MLPPTLRRRAPAAAAAHHAAPQRAGDLAYRSFCRPDLSPYRPVDHATLVARARVHLARAEPFTVHATTGNVQAYAFEPSRPAASPRTHLLIHGWTGEAAFMAAFIEPLRSRGDRVIAFDLPAHGRSPGPVTARAASLIDCAWATLAVTDHVGPLDSITGHSLGALIAAMIAEGGMPLNRAVAVPRLALLAAPNRVQDVARRYGRELGLAPAAQSRYECHMERAGKRPLRTFSTGHLLSVSRREVLVIHARDDAVVPFADARDLHAEYPSAQFLAVDGLGHAGVLFAPPVVRQVRDFVAPTTTTQGNSDPS